MAIIKCKMCGGDLILEEGSNVAECEYCGSRQTVPTADNEKKMNLFARANRLRANNEFDKAAGVYESIVADFPEEAEAYWGLILCKYGIDYVDDPATGKKIPTCHRSSFDSVMDDPNFELVMENADPIAHRVYREEAKQIEELRKRIIEVSSHEEPYDIFICYKETTDDGQRTLDSVLAQDVYDMLTENGYRVFFSRVTLEDKLGVEYEPYIFAALNSAKIMLAFGTDYDYYNAVWVKNEWSRFLQLIAKGEKKTLIPCYKNIDAYDMPKEFAKLQAQDLGKVGAMQDLLRGVKKVLPKGNPVGTQQIIRQVVQSGPSVDSLLERAYLTLEDGQWDTASSCFQEVLRMDPKNSEAYLGLYMAKNKMYNKTAFSAEYVERELDRETEMRRAKEFANPQQKAWWDQLDLKLQESRNKKELALKEKNYQEALALKVKNYQEASSLQSKAGTELPSEQRFRAIELMIKAGDFKDSAKQAKTLKQDYLRDLKIAANQAEADCKKYAQEMEAPLAKWNELSQQESELRKKHAGSKEIPKYRFKFGLIGAAVGMLIGIIDVIFFDDTNLLSEITGFILAVVILGAVAFAIGVILEKGRSAKQYIDKKATDKALAPIEKETNRLYSVVSKTRSLESSARNRLNEILAEISKVEQI